MALFIVPSSLLIGVAAHYGGLWLPLLINKSPDIWNSVSYLLASNFSMCGLMVFMPVAVVMLGAIFIVLVLGFVWYPVVVGYTIGWLSKRLSRELKCRSPFLAVSMGLIGSATAYTSLSFLRFHVFGTLDTSFSVASFTIDAGSPWWLTVLVAIDALLILALGSLTPLKFVKWNPFCEVSGHWYSIWKSGKLSPKAAGTFLEALSTGTLIDKAPLKRVTQPPDIAINLYKCPSCNASDVQVTVLFEQSRNSSTNKTTIIYEVWLRTMVSAQLGEELAQAISPVSDDSRSPQLVKKL
jgi:uncharacterized membrane protein YeaQ/YmgE (transglycosylase-associated protein family)